MDVRKVELPVLPAQQQRELGEAFRQLAEFARALAETAERCGELARTMGDGLATGAIRLKPVTRKPSKTHRIRGQK